MEIGTKHFRKREAILHSLKQSKAHPSAEDLFVQLKPQIPDLSIGTVYRNLNLFKQQGLAVGIATVKGVERFDGNTDPHVHFICSECGAVTDLEQITVPETLKNAAQESGGCCVNNWQLSFTGICQGCLTQTESGETA